jgi:hypothetical protein
MVATKLDHDDPRVPADVVRQHGYRRDGMITLIANES